MKYFKVYILIVFTANLFLNSSCNQVPENVKLALIEAGNNKEQLEFVIDHYKRLGDNEKLEAAYFLIRGMENKHSIEWTNRHQYNELFDFIRKGNSNKPIIAKWDSLKKINGVYIVERNDLSEIKATTLIDNIDLAFYSWKNMPWGKHYNFAQFCEYILPYRVQDEPLENWRPFYFKAMKYVLDSLKNKSDIREACKYINDYVHMHHKILPSLKEVPKLSNIDAFNNPAGICENRLIVIASLLRTFAIPCAIEYTPQFTNSAGNHSWITLIDTTGKAFAFNGGGLLKYTSTNKIPMGDGKWQATKIYRYAYSSNQNESSRFFLKDPSIDVTSEYDEPQGELKFKVGKNKNIYLCTFGFRWKIVPVAMEKGNNDTVTFKNVGLNSLYFPALAEGGETIPIQNPIFIDSLGNKIQYSPSLKKLQKVFLTRKYPDDGSMQKFGSHILGTEIRGSNRPDFKESVLLHKIENIPYHFVSFFPESKESFKYIRWVAPDSGFIRLSELEFYSENIKRFGEVTGKNPSFDIPVEALTKAVDCNISTWFDAPAKAWLQIKFNNPYSIEKIKYVQRSTLNYIEVGDLYELFYFDKGWKSLGQQIANESYLEFNNVPTNAVLLLRDLTKGQQERVFIYENKIQIWK